MDIVAHIEKNMTDADWAELEEQRARDDAEFERELQEYERKARIEEARETALAEIKKFEGAPHMQLAAGMDFAIAVMTGGRRA